MSAYGWCTAIPAGFYKSRIPFSSVIYVCPAGFYSVTGNENGCQPCPSTYTSNPGDSACSGPCPPGTVLDSNRLCALVPIGEK